MTESDYWTAILGDRTPADVVREFSIVPTRDAMGRDTTRATLDEWLGSREESVTSPVCSFDIPREWTTRALDQLEAAVYDAAIASAIAAVYAADRIARGVPYSRRYSETGDQRHGEYATIEDAIAAAHNDAADGYDLDAVTETWWYDVAIVDEDGDVVDTVTITVDPPEPDCTDPAGHDWHDDDGTIGDGAGVRGSDTCATCGIVKRWQTRPQRRDTGDYAPTMRISYSRVDE